MQMAYGLLSQMICSSYQNTAHIAEDFKVISTQINVMVLSVGLREIVLTGNAAFM